MTVPQNGRFGFINYFVFRMKRRIPVEFFNTIIGEMAWLDGDPVDKRIMVSVTPEMNAKHLGGFPAIMKIYQEEAKKLFSLPHFWNQCIQNDTGLLMLFQAMHTMRTTECTALEGIRSAAASAIEIHDSELAVAEEMHKMFAASSFLDSDKFIDIQPASAPREAGIFHLV